MFARRAPAPVRRAVARWRVRWRRPALASLSAGLSGSLLLHLLILAALLWLRTPPAPVFAEPARPLTVLTLGAPSPPQRASAPDAPAPTPREANAVQGPPAAARPAAPAQPRVPAVRKAPSSPPADPASVTASVDMAAASGSSAAPDSVTTLAAATPDAVAPETPPPIEYLRRVSYLISRAQKYPWSARQYGHQGDVIVRMHLTREGAVLSATVVRSSGYASLDSEARDAVLRIGRFPPFPSDYIPQQREFDIDQPVAFRTYLN